MSDEKKPKPFARVKEFTGQHEPPFGRFAVEVGAYNVGWWEQRASAESIVEHMQAAVEAREAKAHLAGIALLLSLEDWRPPTTRQGECLACGRWTPANHPEAHSHNAVCSAEEERIRKYHEAEALRDAARNIDPAAPVVPRAELDAITAKLKQATAALDVLDPRESMTAQMVAAYLEASGLRKPQAAEFTMGRANTLLRAVRSRYLLADHDEVMVVVDTAQHDAPPRWRRPGEPVSMEPNPRLHPIHRGGPAGKCPECNDTGRILEDHDGIAGYRRCRACE